MVPSIRFSPGGRVPTGGSPQDIVYRPGTFGYDLRFLRQFHPDLIHLKDPESEAAMIIVPAYQARIMTSTLTGNEGTSFGWINHSLIASPQPGAHMNAVGGEDRFWLGPEGGQFSLYFTRGKSFEFENWYVPAPIDTEPFDLVSAAGNHTRFEKEMTLENYSGTRFKIHVTRNISLLTRSGIGELLQTALPADILAVGFESDNSISNAGDNDWEKNTGLVSIWIPGMFNATDHSTVAIPFDEKQPGAPEQAVTADYFGKIPPDRLKIAGGLALFRADGNFRSKIGIGRERVLPIAASYDAAGNVLTIVQFSLNREYQDYVNSLWQLQEDAYNGDVVNAYNDGPLDGVQIGRFYELESSSPAAALKKGERTQHIHRTIHLTGNRKTLDDIARQTLGRRIDELSL